VAWPHFVRGLWAGARYAQKRAVPPRAAEAREHSEEERLVFEMLPRRNDVDDGRRSARLYTKLFAGTAGGSGLLRGYPAPLARRCLAPFVTPWRAHLLPQPRIDERPR
jgi:hypothetical protein